MAKGSSRNVRSLFIKYCINQSGVYVRYLHTYTLHAHECLYISVRILVININNSPTILLVCGYDLLLFLCIVSMNIHIYYYM